MADPQKAFRVEIDQRKLFKQLQKLDKALDKDALLSAIGNKMQQYSNRQFETEGSYSGNPWPALSRNTIAARILLGQEGRILQRTGRFKQSITVRKSGSSVEIGTNLPWASAHQDGTEPFTIVPKNPKGMLVFAVMGPNGPMMAHAKKVNHPGLPKREFLPNAKVTEVLSTELMEHLIQEAADG